ncbi:MAG: DUF47 family protein [Methanocalculus sp. MSAO_Arc1]|uniref:DUF47 domain-containing protein n=1 Tax=Methanocalculus TaxID=71151 RepID=UPI000FED93E6|nr:DUF47 family protein [Methanocalculus sp. MSAO_Arc1]MCP1662490.1 uncharacterized protein Yka (UPF0111/DUF47 family) [Methanocalculus sp. AMF5]RQD80831.1 MAG: DUF47 family protein [Methanocalculus sp. MSAO_Arc1]
MSIRDWILPKEYIFYDIFEQLADTTAEAGRLLVDLVDDYEDVDRKIREIKKLEHQGDSLAHHAFAELSRSFITPLEPAEISRLTTALDDILDFIDNTARKMQNYGIEETDAYMREFAKIVYFCAAEVAKAVREIRSLKNPKLLEQKCIEINRLENLADDVLSHAIQDLFKSEDAIRIIKLKEIYESLEEATDRCEDAANVLADIAIRYS